MRILHQRRKNTTSRICRTHGPAFHGWPYNERVEKTTIYCTISREMVRFNVGILYTIRARVLHVRAVSKCTHLLASLSKHYIKHVTHACKGSSKLMSVGHFDFFDFYPSSPSNEISRPPHSSTKRPRRDLFEWPAQALYERSHNEFSSVKTCQNTMHDFKWNSGRIVFKDTSQRISEHTFMMMGCQHCVTCHVVHQCRAPASYCVSSFF